MVRDIYVIVHEEALKGLDFRGDELARTVLTEINTIKQNKEFHEVKDLPGYIPLSLPRPSKNLQVYVVGISKWNCCIIQLYALRTSGYSVKLHDLGCYDNGHKSLVLNFTPDARRLVPEFFTSE